MFLCIYSNHIESKSLDLSFVYVLYFHPECYFCAPRTLKVRNTAVFGLSFIKLLARTSISGVWYLLISPAFKRRLSFPPLCSLYSFVSTNNCSALEPSMMFNTLFGLQKILVSNIFTSCVHFPPSSLQCSLSLELSMVLKMLPMQLIFCWLDLFSHLC